MGPAVSGYDVLGRVDVDAPGAVLRARRVADGREVALRPVPERDLAGLRAMVPGLVALEDPHVVAVQELLEGPDGAFLALDWVDGATLVEVRASGARLLVGQRLGVIRGMLTGLASAHAQGVVHGRISLSNILLDTDGVARLIDFGLGDPVAAYLPPEPGADDRGTAAADVYAVAAVLVHLLTDRTVGEQSRELLAIDASLRSVLVTALSPAPADRYADASALLEALGKAAKRAYGKVWWTEAGIGSLVGSAVAELVPLAPAPAPVVPVADEASGGKQRKPRKPRTEREPRAPRPRRSFRVPRGIIAAAIGLITVGAVVLGAVAVQILGEDQPPDPVSLRTDLFCDRFTGAAEAAIGPDARTGFTSSGSSGATLGPKARASVSCFWGVESPAQVVTVTVGSASERDATSPERLAAVIDGASQDYVAAQKSTWKPSYATDCEELDEGEYDTAFSCFAPSIQVEDKPLRAGTGVVQFGIAVRDQALVCGGSLTVDAASDRESFDDLVAEVGRLCAEVLPAVRRGG
ncbi:serine/threonine protein kinase [Nocardioides sp. Root190]|uniref:serine/threonine protein kinase n=1 Tax=Nocardioides sp. Root190 TaxID=1736488 RepID=UPI00138F7387|nr:hypothetical protein [Nocardioides sp. Root190]